MIGTPIAKQRDGSEPWRENMNLNGKTVVVVGAGSGIGRAVAVDAANAGAGGTVRVVDASREEDVAVQANAVLFALTNPLRTRAELPIDGGTLLM